MSNYTVLHLHTMLSSVFTTMDSITKYTDYILRAKELEMSAIAFSEHGNVMEWVHKKEFCDKNGIKYIHASEVYVTESLEDKKRDNYHCVLFSKNYDGVLELNKLLSHKGACNREDGHFYYQPRITFDELINTSDNIIVSTACLGGILFKGNEIIKDRFIQFLSENKHRCFLEIQHHLAPEQMLYNQYLHELSEETGVRLITGTDTHALNEEHMDGRSILQKAKGIHFDEEDLWDLSFKSYDELVDCYVKQKSLPMDVVLNAIENTNVLADMVESFELDRSYKYPNLWEDSMGTFKKKIVEGIKWRGVDKYPNFREYMDRIKYEIETYKFNGAIDFMLLMEDIISWCVQNEIYVGYGRGSVNGSVIAWLLGITEMDSIKHGLNFERFMNTERVSLSDIDTDFPPSRREDVKDYIYSKTGLYCCDIVTFNTVAMKGAIRDVGRALEMDLKEVGVICSTIESDEITIRKAYPLLFKYVDIINGVIVSVGSHPCGTLVSPHAIDDKIGTFMSSTSKYPISQINMKEIDGLNYVKLDLLGLDSIEIINDVCKLAGIERLTPDNVDDSDDNVWDSIRNDTTQIFQWEGATGDKYIKNLLSDTTIESFKIINPNVRKMDLLSIGNSAIRPAGASYREELGNGKFRKMGFTVLDEFLSETYSFLIYQEQILAFLNRYCGYSMGKADMVRRAFAKKTGTESHIPEIRSGFIKTMARDYGKTKEESEDAIVTFIKVIEDASDYLFSLNHSQPYSYTGYIAGYLRYYHPLEFLTVSLNVNKNNEEKTCKLNEYAGSIGIKIKNPTFRYSKAEYFLDKSTNTIYKGVGSVKFLNNKVADELYNIKNVEFKTFINLLVYMLEDTALNSRQIDTLIKINYFNEFGKNKKLDIVYDEFQRRYKKTHVDKTKEKRIAELIEFESTVDNKPYTIKEQYKYEIDKLGYAITVLPQASPNLYVVSDYDDKYGIKLKCYNIRTGDVTKFTMYKDDWKLNPIGLCSIIQFEKYLIKKDGSFRLKEYKYI